MDNRSRRKLRDEISKLSNNEHAEIFKILKSHYPESFMKNKNGVFFDLNEIDVKILEELNKFVEFCLSNKAKLDDYDRHINEYKQINCIDKKNNISVSLTQVINSDHPKENWYGLLAEVKSNEKINAFVNLLENNSERYNFRRSGNCKFINAKKKYSKKLVSDKKNDYEYINNLTAEPYKDLTV